MIRELLPEARTQMGPTAFDGLVTDALARVPAASRERWALRDVAALYEALLASDVLVASYADKVLLRYQPSTGELILVDDA